VEISLLFPFFGKGRIFFALFFVENFQAISLHSKKMFPKCLPLDGNLHVFA
jgi:hypothetical protein